jgi:hypothetical protein
MSMCGFEGMGERGRESLGKGGVVFGDDGGEIG